MTEYAKEFFNSKYEVLTTLSDKARTRVELVKNAEGVILVKKTIMSGNTVCPLLKDINCSGIPLIFDILSMDTETIVIEEYIGGQTLQFKMDSGAVFDVHTITKWLSEICAILKPLHSAGIIHRDIKPSNIIISNDGFLKLIDFDSSRVYSSSNTNDTVYLGTKGYAPPEQYGYAQTDERSDIYSLGILLKQLLTWYSSGTSGTQTLFKIIEKCTMLDPKDRYQNIAQIEHLLKADSISTESSANRFEKILNLKNILKIIVLLIFIAAILDTVLRDKKDAFGTPILAIIGYFIIIIPPIAFALNFLKIRTYPLFKNYRTVNPSIKNKIWYAISFFLIWLFVIILFAAIFDPFR